MPRPVAAQDRRLHSRVDPPALLSGRNETSPTRRFRASGLRCPRRRVRDLSRHRPAAVRNEAERGMGRDDRHHDDRNRRPGPACRHADGERWSVVRVGEPLAALVVQARARESERPGHQQGRHERLPCRPDRRGERRARPAAAGASAFVRVPLPHGVPSSPLRAPRAALTRVPVFRGSKRRDWRTSPRAQRQARL
jgi:hypothetical protein